MLRKGFYFPGQKEGEAIEFYTHRHWVSVISLILMTLFIVALPPALFMIFNKVNLLTTPGLLQNILVLGGSVYYLVAILFFFVWWLDYYYDILIVTSERLVDIEQKGLFNRDISELSLYRVQDVTGKISGVLGSIFGFGNVLVQTAATEEQFIIKGVPRPYFVAQKIMELHNNVVNNVAENEDVPMLHVANDMKVKLKDEKDCRSLGQILIDEGYITEKQLKSALDRQKSSGQRIGSTLVSMGAVDEEVVAQALGRQQNIKPFDLSGLKIDDRVVHLIPEHIARKYCCIAIAKADSLLTVAMSDPQNAESVEDVGEMIGLKIAPVIAPQISIREAIDRHYGLALPEDEEK